MVDKNDANIHEVHGSAKSKKGKTTMAQQR
jgi:hypothetical protein